MKRIYVPTASPADWKRLLAQPERHWKPAYSAMSVAQSWEAADGMLPPEIAALLAKSSDDSLHSAELLLALPEYQVNLPGGVRPTQTDIFALIRTASSLAALAIEGKVDETFGPTIDEKRAEGAAARLQYLHELLKLDSASSGSLRYQLLHRAAAAILIAERFHAKAGLLIVHSFSSEDRWLEDFQKFGNALGVEAKKGRLAEVGIRGDVAFHIGWASGDPRFRADLTAAAV